MKVGDPEVVLATMWKVLNKKDQELDPNDSIPNEAAQILIIRVLFEYKEYVVIYFPHPRGVVS